jgi:ABC-type lipoprotein release transport system permease subunit
MDTITNALAREYPRENQSRGALIVGLHDFLSNALKPTLLILMGAVVIVLLIACANVANLTLARASQRERELAVRAALGAGRGRLVRQLLIEGIAVSLIGGTLGLMMANWESARSLRWLQRIRGLQQSRALTPSSSDSRLPFHLWSGYSRPSCPPCALAEST